MSKIFSKKRCNKGGGHGSKGGLLDDKPKAIKTNKVTPKIKNKKYQHANTHSSCALEFNNTKCETPNTLLGGGINLTSKQKKLKLKPHSYRIGLQ